MACIFEVCGSFLKHAHISLVTKPFPVVLAVDSGTTTITSISVDFGRIIFLATETVGFTFGISVARISLENTLSTLCPI
jgi:hypothetical protein